MKSRVVLLSLLSLLLLLTSCAQSRIIRNIEVTRVVSQNVEVTRIIQQTVMVTQIKTVIITATPKPATVIPSPTYTFGPTNTPVPTKTPIPTIDPQIKTATAQAALDLALKKDHGPGLYLVGVDIAPGVWRSTPGLDGCYWSRTTITGDIIDNYYGLSGGTIYINPSDFQVEINEECGTWTWLSAP
jgi:hypothetical protein